MEFKMWRIVEGRGRSLQVPRQWPRWRDDGGSPSPAQVAVITERLKTPQEVGTLHRQNPIRLRSSEQITSLEFEPADKSIDYQPQ